MRCFENEKNERIIKVKAFRAFRVSQITARNYFSGGCYAGWSQDSSELHDKCTLYSTSNFSSSLGTDSLKNSLGPDNFCREIRGAIGAYGPSKTWLFLNIIYRVLVYFFKGRVRIEPYFQNLKDMESRLLNLSSLFIDQMRAKLNKGFVYLRIESDQQLCPHYYQCDVIFKMSP